MHIPAPAGAGSRVSRGEGARALSARSRRVAPLPLARAAGAGGLDARLRRRRSDAALRGARRRGRVSRAVRRRARARAGRRAGHRSEPHGGGRREPVVARSALAGEVLRPRLADGLAPPLLRRRRARGRAGRGSGGLGADAPQDRRARARGVDRRRQGRPSGRAREAAALPRAAARGGARADLGREDPRAGRAAARGLAGGGHDRVRVPERRDGALRRPRRRGAAHAALRGGVRRAAGLCARLRREAKLEQAQTTFADEAAQLAARLPFEADVARALASFHVYRTYVDPDAGSVAAEDRAEVARAGLPERLARILLLEERGHDAFVLRFQQTTPPVHAKGVEDTAFYRWHRLVALNEVGGDPGRFSLSVADFHRANLARPPLGLLATTTHDTKRSGDVRARLACIAADPDGWAALVRAAARRLARPERGVPDPADGRRGVAAGRGPARALPREGASRGEGEHELARAGSRMGVGREALGGRAARRRGGRPRMRGGWRRAATRLRSG